MVERSCLAASPLSSFPLFFIHKQRWATHSVHVLERFLSADEKGRFCNLMRPGAGMVIKPGGLNCGPDRHEGGDGGRSKGTGVGLADR